MLRCSLIINFNLSKSIEHPIFILLSLSECRLNSIVVLIGQQPAILTLLQFLYINIVTRESVVNERGPFLQILVANKIRELWFLHFTKHNVTTTAHKAVAKGIK